MCTSSSGIDQVELTGVDARAHPFQPGDDGVALGFGQDALTRKHGGVGDRALDVVAIEPAVEVDRGGEGFDEGVGRGIEAPGPGFGG
jgi:hypothetical protein